jgi:hypothetical protein
MRGSQKVGSKLRLQIAAPAYVSSEIEKSGHAQD